MKVLILDHTPNDAKELKEKFTAVYKGTCQIDLVSSMLDMSTLYKEENYDIVIVDIDKDAKAAFSFIDESYDRFANFIVTSASKDSMIQAFNHHVIGYLCKPYATEEIEHLIKRITRRGSLAPKGKSDKFEHFKKLIADGSINRIALATLDGFIIVHYDDIIRCEANGNYTSIYFEDGSFLMLTKTLKHYSSKLEKHGFFRVHKTHLVNMKFIRSYVKGKNSYVQLKDGSNIEVSSRKKQTLVEHLLPFSN